MKRKIYTTMKGLKQKIHIIILLSGCVLTMALSNCRRFTPIGNSGLWKLSGHTLVISGTGTMPDFGKSNLPPWYLDIPAIQEVDMQTSGPTTIGTWAFYSCLNLVSVRMPEGVTSIGDRAFYECKVLAFIHLPEGMTSIETEAFRGCESLVAVDIPASVTTIGELAFGKCSSSNKITVHWTDPSRVKFGKTAFS
jgi:hypothetical protein